MKPTRQLLIAIIASGLWLVAGAAAQQTGDNAPPIAGSTTLDSSVSSGTELTPDTRPLTGAQPFTLGTPGDRRSSMDITLDASEAVDTNVFLSPTQRGNQGVANVSGNVNLQKVASRSDMSLMYTVGGWMTETGAEFRSMYHQLGLSDTFDLRRWNLVLAENLAYSPQAFFGFPGSGVFEPTVSPGYLPNQNIFLTGNRFSSATTAQATYELNGRSSLTGVADFSLLDMLGNGFNSRSEQFVFGYNRQMTQIDTIGLSYSANLTQFPGASSNLIYHGANLSYGRRMTGKMALQATAGTQFATGNATGSSSYINWSAGLGLTYQMKSAVMSLSYHHGVNSGGGLWLGGVGDSVTAAISRPLGRTTNFGAHAGFTHSSSLLLQTGTTAGGLTIPNSFDGAFGGVFLTRPVSRSGNIHFNYNVQYQSSNLPFCYGIAQTLCSGSVVRHVFGVGFNWKMGPWGLGW